MNPDDNRVDLASVNKTKKQFKLLKISNPFKKQAGPKRDNEGKFAPKKTSILSGSGGLTDKSSFKWSRVAPLAAVVALVGGFLVYKSFAGTYKACQNVTDYTYAQDCVTDSSEASVVRLYYGIFNRAPDKTGLQYWAERLNTKKSTLTAIAKQFMGSSEFKNKYGSLSNENFVKAMYPQVFGRTPDASGLGFWTNRLNTKVMTREAVMVNFTESSEMKRDFAFTVARDLGIENYLTGRKLTNAMGVFECYGSVATASDGSKWCNVQIKNNILNGQLVVGNIPLNTSELTISAQAQTKVKLLNASGSKLTCAGIGIREYSNNITSNQASFSTTNTFGGGMGGCPEITGTDTTTYMHITKIRNDNNGLMVMQVSPGWTQAGPVDELSTLPANAMISVKMSGIEVQEMKYGYEKAYPVSQVATSAQIVSEEALKIKGIQYNANVIVPYVNLRAGFDWSQSADTKLSGNAKFRLTGSTKINTEESDLYNLKFKVKVTNIDTGEVISGGKLKITSYQADGTVGWRVVELKSASNGEYTLASDAYSQDEIGIVTDSAFPSRYKYEVDITSAPANYRLFNSYVGSGIY